MTKHTHGPWTRRNVRAQNIVSKGWHIEAADGSTIAVVLGDQSEELQSNARLIAAAPAMLATLRSILESGELENEWLEGIAELIDTVS